MPPPTSALLRKRRREEERRRRKAQREEQLRGRAGGRRTKGLSEAGRIAIGQLESGGPTLRPSTRRFTREERRENIREATRIGARTAVDLLVEGERRAGTRFATSPGISGATLIGRDTAMQLERIPGVSIATPETIKRQVPQTIPGAPPGLNIALEAALIPTRGVGQTIRQGALTARAIQRTGNIGKGIRLARRTKQLQVGGFTLNASKPNGIVMSTADRVADSLRPSRRRFGIKSREGKAGLELQRQQETFQKLLQGQASAIRRTARRLTPSQMQALRMVGEGDEIAERIAFHGELAQAAADEGRLVDSLLHSFHKELNESASKYIVREGGHNVLSPTAPTKLKNTLREVERSAETREQILKEIGLLMDEEIAGRIQAPGRVVGGARFFGVRQATQARNSLTREIKKLGKQERKLSRQRIPKAETRAARVGAVKEASLEQRTRTISKVRGSVKVQQQTLDKSLERLQSIDKRIADTAVRDIGAEATPTTLRGFPQADIRAGARTKGPRLKEFQQREIARMEKEREAALKTVNKNYDDLVRLEQRMEKLVASAARAEEAAIAAGTARAQQIGKLKAELTQVRNTIDDLSESLIWVDENAGRLVGVEGFSGGRFYVPYVRGLPVNTWKQGILGTKEVLRALGTRPVGKALSALRRGGSVGRGAETERRLLKKAYTGNAQIKGAFRIDVPELTAESLMKAGRVASAEHTHNTFLKIAETLPPPREGMPGGGIIPTSIDDIPVRTKDAFKSEWSRRGGSRRVQEVWDRLEIARASGEKLQISELQDLNIKLIEDLKDAAIPGFKSDKLSLVSPSGEVEEFFFREAADKVMHEGFQAPGIVWLPRDLVIESKILNDPLFTKAAEKFLQKPWGELGAAEFTGRTAVAAVDAVNDIGKLSILYLNPAYITHNVAGNAFMNLVQQGPYAAINIPRAAKLSRDMSRLHVQQIDELIGHGFAATVPLRLGPSGFTHTAAQWMNTIVDLVPRRAAFLYEARRAGYGNATDLGRLLDDATRGNQKALEQLNIIRTRAVDAIVDYERLGPFERAIVTRGVFFYPWLKGSTRWTAQFVLNHPVQAAVYSYLGYYVNQDQQEELGRRPYWLQFAITGTPEVPIPGTGVSIPGVQLPEGEFQEINPETGEIETVRRPQITRVHQLFGGAAQTAELGLALGKFVMGDPSGAPPPILDTPFFDALITARTGVDELGREVDKGLPTFFNQMWESTAPKRFKELAELWISGELNEEQARLNRRSTIPRTPTQRKLQPLLGSFTLSGYNRDNQERRNEIEDRAQGIIPTLEEKISNRMDFLDQQAVEYGLNLVPEVRRNYEVREIVEHFKAEARREKKEEGAIADVGRQVTLTQLESLEAEIEAFRSIPEFREQVDWDEIVSVARRSTGAKIEDMRRKLKEVLTFPDGSPYNSLSFADNDNERSWATVWSRAVEDAIEQREIEKGLLPSG